MSGFIYRVGEGAGLAAVLASILLWANLAEAWRKRRYEAAFIAKLSDAEGEAAETQVHLEFAFRHSYISRDEFVSGDDKYEKICAQIVRMIDEPEKWLIRRPDRK